MHRDSTARCRGCGVNVGTPDRHELCPGCYAHALLRAGAEHIARTAEAAREHREHRHAVARVRGALRFLERWERRGGTFA